MASEMKATRRIFALCSRPESHDWGSLHIRQAVATLYTTEGGNPESDVRPTRTNVTLGFICSDQDDDFFEDEIM
jgi:hypothetical protein